MDITGQAPARMAGLYAEGRIEASSSVALVIPASALVRDGERAFAWRVSGGRLHKVALTLGERDLNVVRAFAGLAAERIEASMASDAELAETDQDTVRCEVAPGHVRPLDEQERRQQGEGEAQGREPERRQMIEPEAYNDEIRAPHRHHCNREQKVQAWKGGVLWHRSPPNRSARLDRKSTRLNSSH